MVDTIRVEQGVTPSAPSPPPKRRWWRRGSLPYVLLIPAILLELLIHFIPMVAGVWISFLQLTLFYLRNWSAAPFAGLTNYPIAVNFTSATGRRCCTLSRSPASTPSSSSPCPGCSAWPPRSPCSARSAAGVRPHPLPDPIRDARLRPVITWKFMFQRHTGVINQILVFLHLVQPRPFWLIGHNSFVAGRRALWRTWPFAFLMLMAGPADHQGRPLRGGGARRRRDPGQVGTSPCR